MLTVVSNQDIWFIINASTKLDLIELRIQNRAGLQSPWPLFDFLRDRK